MSTYVEDTIKILKEKQIKITPRSVAVGLRFTLGDEKIEQISEALLHNYSIRYNKLNEDTYINAKVNEENDYNIFWIAKKLIEMDNAEVSEDGFKYPSHRWISGELFEPLSMIREQANRLKGVHCDNGVIYPEGSCYNTKGFWCIDFDTIEDFNHFLWAGCYRYLPLSKSNTWRLMPNLGDPNYKDNKIRMELHYLNLNAKKDEILEDIEKFTVGLKEYADNEETIRKNLVDY